MCDERARIIALADEAMSSGEPLDWFERVYREAAGETERIPWADGQANPLFVDWYSSSGLEAGRALVVGCGLGEEAVFLAERGWDVTAFDISQTAIEWAKSRFPRVVVDWMVSDMLNLPADWAGSFDLVVEIHVLQAIPQPIRERARIVLAPLIANGARLVCIGRLREAGPEPEGPPWPLSRNFIDSIGEGLINPCFEEVRKPDDEPEVRRFLASWSR